MALPYVWKRHGKQKQLYLRSDGRLIPVDSRHVHDRLTARESELGAVPALFWDHANARPRIRTPAAFDYAWSREIPNRYQGERSTCVPFAVLAAIELCALRKGVRLDLSRQYANWLFNSRCVPPFDWCISGRVRLADSLRWITRYGVCREDLCPYEMPANCAASPTEEMHRNARYGISKLFFIDRLQSAANECPGSPCVDGPGMANTLFLEAILAQNYDIVCAVDWITTNKAGDIYVVPPQYSSRKKGACCSPRSASGSHALVIVGYNRVGEIPYFVCRTSNDDGHDGHVFLSYDYMRNYGLYGAVVMEISQELEAAPHVSAKKPRRIA